MSSLRARVKASFGQLDRDVAWIFLVSIIAQSLFWYFARVPFMEDALGLSAEESTTPVFAHWGTSFVLFALLSLIVIKLPLRSRLADFGMQRGDLRFALKGALVTWIVFAAPILLGGKGMADVGAEYPLSKAAAASWATLGPYLLAYGVYYVGWEIHFRGFMLFGLARKLGPWVAIFAQTVPSVLIHAGKPPGETFGAIFAGLVWGWLALESRTILGPLLAHWALGITNDIVMSWHFHGLH